MKASQCRGSLSLFEIQTSRREEGIELGSFTCCPAQGNALVRAGQAMNMLKATILAATSHGPWLHSMGSDRVHQHVD